jgi:hypothetical protein
MTAHAHEKKTFADLVKLAKQNKLNWNSLSHKQRFELELYSAQGGFRGTGTATQ